MTVQQALKTAQTMEKRLNQQRAGVKRIAAIKRQEPIKDAEAAARRIYFEILELLSRATPDDLAAGEIEYIVTIRAGDPLTKILNHSVETAQRGRK